ncbi:MAG: glycosyltransferase family 4 protein [Verrucomicrobia bacterium]|nr:glycosyltransferase family 4 protein [Verrucomicrobiota bacterium]
MNIGLVRRGFSRTGGAEAYLKRVARSLVDAGHSLTLYSSTLWPIAEWPYGKLVRIAAQEPVRFADELRKKRNAEEILFSLERIWECNCYRAGDGVHRVWLRERAKYESSWKAKFRFLNSKHAQICGLEQALFRPSAADQVIANSALIKNQIISEFGYPADRIRVIYNGLPHFVLGTSARARTRSLWRLRPQDTAVVFAGTGWKRKGLRYAIEAIQMIKDRRIRLIVIGADRKPPLRSSRILYFGPSADIHSLLAGGDLFVLPTIYDPFSNACLEALSLGMPVITTRSNGFSEIISPGTHGDVIDMPNDVDSLSLSIESWSKIAKSQEIRSSCIQLAGQYSIDRNVTETLQVLESFVSKRP